MSYFLSTMNLFTRCFRPNSLFRDVYSPNTHIEFLSRPTSNLQPPTSFERLRMSFLNYRYIMLLTRSRPLSSYLDFEKTLEEKEIIDKKESAEGRTSNLPYSKSMLINAPISQAESCHIPKHLLEITGSNTKTSPTSQTSPNFYVFLLPQHHIPASSIKEKSTRIHNLKGEKWWGLNEIRTWVIQAQSRELNHSATASSF
ncbi:hypothetical protein GQR58_012346 [Nymphon striatum]|nr:hypothetical protein GQR58_012346 [Nymphon striatum]